MSMFDVPVRIANPATGQNILGCYCRYWRCLLYGRLAFGWIGDNAKNA